MTRPDKSARPDKANPETLGFATQAIHVGNPVGEESGVIQTPIFMGNSYALPYDPLVIDWSGADTPVYTRYSSANQVALQQRIAVLEGGDDAVVLASGVAALHGLFFSTLKTGDHAVISDTTYGAVWRIFAELFPAKYGIDGTFVDTSDPDAVRAALRSNTKLIFTETIANPTTRVADVQPLADIAHEHGALLCVDSTFTPPPLYRHLDDGADCVVQSLTKYINGHGDAMGGAVIGRSDLIREIKTDAMIEVGGTISPFNAWLIQRGSVTLPLRLARHQENAQQIAAFLDSHPKVAYVYYPGLPSHPGHELAKRQFQGRGYGGMLAFAVNGDPDTQNRFVSNLRLITPAVSLGHDQTLILHTTNEGPRVAYYPQPFKDYGHLRLSVGLEDPEDVIADLETALELI